jgi:hypothetical protein
MTVRVLDRNPDATLRLNIEGQDLLLGSPAAARVWVRSASLAWCALPRKVRRTHDSRAHACPRRGPVTAVADGLRDLACELAVGSRASCRARRTARSPTITASAAACMSSWRRRPTSSPSPLSRWMLESTWWRVRPARWLPPGRLRFNPSATHQIWPKGERGCSCGQCSCPCPHCDGEFEAERFRRRRRGAYRSGSREYRELAALRERVAEVRGLLRQAGAAGACARGVCRLRDSCCAPKARNVRGRHQPAVRDLR